MSKILQTRLQLCLDASGRKASAVCQAAGVGKDTIRNILRGRSTAPSADAIVRIACELGTTTEYLYGITARSERSANRVADTPSIDTGLLTEIIYSVQTWLDKSGLTLDPMHFATLVSQLYAHFAAMKTASDRSAQQPILQDLELGSLDEWLKNPQDDSPSN